MGSDVARIRKQIEDELHAMRGGLTGLAIVAKHEMITHRIDALGKYHEQFALTIGDDAAKTYVCEAYIRIVQ